MEDAAVGKLEEALALLLADGNRCRALHLVREAAKALQGDAVSMETVQAVRRPASRRKCLVHVFGSSSRISTFRFRPPHSKMHRVGV